MLLGNTHWTLECSAADVGWPNCTVCRNYFKSFPLLHIFYSRKKCKCSMQRINLQSVSCMQLVTKVVRVARLHPITAIKR